MSPIKLKRLLSKRKATTSLITKLMVGLGISITILDAKGKSLLGSAEGDFTKKEPITHEGETLGWVVSQKSKAIADLMMHLVRQEAEKKSLAGEVLDRYRELNLLYNLSEKLSASLELKKVTKTAIDEASRLIQATAGALLLLNEESNTFEASASFGSDAPTSIKLGQNLVAKIAQSGKAEIVNDVPSDVRGGAAEQWASLLCAPLIAKDKVIGVIVLLHANPIIYSASDLKLLRTVASQSTPAIENALLYEKTIRLAREREERLKEQIQSLRIELDEARQEKQVAEITESDYFQHLRSQASTLRQIIQSEGY